MFLDHPNIFGCMLALSNVLSQEWVPGSAIIADFYQQLGKEAFVWLLAQFLNKWLLSQPLQIPPHHHQHFQVQTSHSDHARNVIKSLHGDKLIISSGYEQTHECGFWPCCLMRGHPREAGGLVSFHPTAIDGTWEPWSKLPWPLFPQVPHCTCFQQGSTQHRTWLPRCACGQPRHAPDGRGWAPGARPTPPAAQHISQPGMSLPKADPALLSLPR